ncbi:MAG: Rrf2 family transcriptional regulator [Deltaproteobacteria bacterium]|nr:Rrf2 family transcriptional regulator [Deltaproteobacteria bacterium]
MKLSTKSRYGSRLLIDLASHRDQWPVQIGAISKRLQLPVKYLEQIIRILKKHQFVTSFRGAKGGYILAKEPEEISLGEIVRLFENTSELVECISHPELCMLSNDCRVRLAWAAATDAMFRHLDAVTIADLEMPV